MKARKILFPTDFSPYGQEALRWATSLARDTGATLIITHVEEPPMAYGGGEMYLGAEEGDLQPVGERLGAGGWGLGLAVALSGFALSLLPFRFH